VTSSIRQKEKNPCSNIDILILPVISLLKVSKLIRANSELIHNDVDTFYVQLGGFDTHTDAGGVLASKLSEIDSALTR
jgi:hypothetical protein